MSMSMSTSQFYMQPRLTVCHNHSTQITKLHPVNLVLLQELFDKRTTEHMFADTTFVHPVNVSIPSFNLYKHAMHDIIADDTKSHLSLKKMAVKAKQDAVIFQSLTEPLLEGDIAINADWPDLNAILIIVTMSVMVLSSMLVIQLFFKLRKLSTSMLVLQQALNVKALSTDTPSFRYHTATDVSQTLSAGTFSLNLEWTHATFIVGLLILGVTLITLFYVIKRRNSDMPYLCAEITTTKSCLLLPVI